MTPATVTFDVKVDSQMFRRMGISAANAAEALSKMSSPGRRAGKALLATGILEYLVTPSVIRRRKHRALTRSRRNTAYKSRKHGRQVRTR